MARVPTLFDIKKDAIWDREPISAKVETVLNFARVENGNPQRGKLMPNAQFLIRAVRCAFLEKGSPVPVSDPIYWESSIVVEVNQKMQSPLHWYHRNIAAYCADPVLLLGATDISRIPEAKRYQLFDQVTASLTAKRVETGSDQMLGGHLPEITGIMVQGESEIKVSLFDAQKYSNRVFMFAFEGTLLFPIQFL